MQYVTGSQRVNGVDFNPFDRNCITAIHENGPLRSQCQGNMLSMLMDLVSTLDDVLFASQAFSLLLVAKEQIDRPLDQFPELISQHVHKERIGSGQGDLDPMFFGQVDGMLTRGVRGTGLGLAITKSLVEMMGGKLTLQSELGKGAVFSVELALEVVAVPGARLAPE